MHRRTALVAVLGLLLLALVLPATAAAADFPSKDSGYHTYAEMVAEIKAQGRKVRELGATFNAIFHQDGHRAGSIALAAEMFGLLGPDAFLSHCTDLTEADIAALVKSGAHVVHNPTAIAAVTGFCPVVKLLDAGVNVAVGSGVFVNVDVGVGQTPLPASARCGSAVMMPNPMTSNPATNRASPA